MARLFAGAYGEIIGFLLLLPVIVSPARAVGRRTEAGRWGGAPRPAGGRRTPRPRAGIRTVAAGARVVAAGGAVVGAGVAGQLLAGSGRGTAYDLTEREADVLGR